MKKIGFLVLVVFSFFAFAETTNGQRRTTRPAAPKTVVPDAQLSADLKTGSDKVASQIVNITRFLYVLGGAAKGIEDLDNDTSANQAARDVNSKNKRTLIQTIQNLRAGILALEIEFKTKEPMKKHVALVQGITELAAQSEDLAAAGRFSESGRPLLIVVEKLSDALAAL